MVKRLPNPSLLRVDRKAMRDLSGDQAGLVSWYLCLVSVFLDEPSMSAIFISQCGREAKMFQ